MADFGITEAAAAITAALSGEAAGAAGAVGATGVGADIIATQAPLLAGSTLTGVGAVDAGLLPTVAGGSLLPSLATVGEVAGGAGSLLSAVGGIRNASYTAAAQRAEAAALAQKANQDAAAGEQQQIARNRQTALVMSRAQAVAADSGTDATSPDVLTTESRTAGQGTYNALSSLYAGQTAARNDTYQGAIDLFNANQINRGAPLTAAGTILGGISSFADKRARLRYLTDPGTTSTGSLSSLFPNFGSVGA
jgi:hypothetical protein